MCLRAAAKIMITSVVTDYLWTNGSSYWWDEISSTIKNLTNPRLSQLIVSLDYGVYIHIDLFSVAVGDDDSDSVKQEIETDD